MARAKPETIRSVRQTPYDRKATSRPNQPEVRRDSAFQSLSRSISKAFNRVIGQQTNKDAPLQYTDRIHEHSYDDAKDGPSAISDSTTHMSNVSDAALPAAHYPTHRDFSVKKPRVDISLLRNCPDLNLPAHVIVEAYRDALRSRSQLEPISKINVKQHTGSPLVRYDGLPRLSGQDVSLQSLPSRVESRQSSRLDKLGPNNNQESDGRSRHASLRPQKKGSVLKLRDSKHVKSRIQLIAKPIVDISQLPEERKKRPGYYSANFDISESDDEETHSQVPNQSQLLKRPTVESSKMKTADESGEKNAQVNENSAEKKPSVSFNIQTLPEKFAFSDSDGAKPKDELSKSGTSEVSNGISFSFNSKLKSVPDYNATSTSSLNTNDRNTNKDKGFTFTSSTATNADSLGAKPIIADAKPAFSFGKPAENSGDKEETPTFTPQVPATFSFGKAQSTDRSEPKPSFNFGATSFKQSTQSSTTARDIASNPETQKSDKDKTGGKFNFNFGTSSSDSVEPTTTSFQFSKPSESNSNIVTTKPVSEFKFGKIDSTVPSQGANGTEAVGSSKLSGSGKLKTTSSFGTVGPSIMFGSAASPAPVASITETPANTSSEPKTLAPIKPLLFGNAAQTDQPKAQFNFGKNLAPATSAGFTFNGPKEPPANSTSGAQASLSTNSAFTFGGGKVGSFTSQPLNFGQPGTTQSTQPTQPTPPVFSFGKNSQSASNGLVATNSVGSFGVSNGTFGQPAEVPSAFGAQTVSSQPFGSSSQASQPGFGVDTSSRESTPGAQQQRKIAQVKRRLRR